MSNPQVILHAPPPKSVVSVNVMAPKTYIFVAIGLSILFHLLFTATSNWIIPMLGSGENENAAMQPMKVTLLDSPDSVKLIDVRQKETEKPETSKYQSYENHRAEKQQRLAPTDDLNLGRIAPPKQATVQADQKIDGADVAQQTNEILNSLRPSKRKIVGYSQLLPKTSDLQASYEAGIQSFLDDQIAIGDVVDLDTTSTRWMGYATHLRKAIEYVWVYPQTAVARGFEGSARVFFVIDRDGSVSRVRLLKSTGYKILDDAILEAITLASPFPPLPESYPKQKLPMTGVFRYVLTSSYARY